MSERINEGVEHKDLVDPIEFAQLLNAVAHEVSQEELTRPEIRKLIDDMLWLAAGKDKEGGAQMVGLAAPQIGVGKRVAIIDTNATGMREEQRMQTLINPRIVEQAGDFIDGREGCWSCGDYCANVPRASWVVVEALDREGDPVSIRLEGFTARIAQHEVDHLNGIRCIDRVPADEPWRMHRVDLNDKDEFDRYRTEWPHWQKTFPREEWLTFREGKQILGVDRMPEAVIAKGKLFELVHREQPDGRVFELARRAPGVRIIIADKTNRKILLTKEFRQELNDWDYRLPGGKVYDTLDEYETARHSGEDILEAAKRKTIGEAAEEAGITVQSATLFKKSTLGATVEWDLFVMEAQGWSKSEAGQALEQGEQIVADEWFDFKQAEQMIYEGKMQEDRVALILLQWLKVQS